MSPYFCGFPHVGGVRVCACVCFVQGWGGIEHACGRAGEEEEEEEEEEGDAGGKA